jgi:hypothetical protein
MLVAHLAFIQIPLIFLPFLLLAKACFSLSNLHTLQLYYIPG